MKNKAFDVEFWKSVRKDFLKSNKFFLCRASNLFKSEWGECEIIFPSKSQFKDACYDFVDQWVYEMFNWPARERNYIIIIGSPGADRELRLQFLDWIIAKLENSPK
jgi:hypothetical protein